MTSSSSGRAKASTRRILFALLAALAAGCQSPAARTPETPSAAPRSVATTRATNDDLEAAFRDHRSNIWVEGSGTVARLLRDDTKRPRHQRFVVDLGTGHTILIAHNIDLAPRVPFKKGDAVEFRGEYIWGEQGGTVHWTHRDPHGGKDSGGWIRWRGQVFR